MITVCKQCGAALDETRPVCPDCGGPNPWADPDPEAILGGRSPAGSLSVLFGLSDDVRLERTLLVLGACCLSIGLVAFMSLTATPWWELALKEQCLFAGLWFFGVADVLLAVYGTLDEPNWRRLAVGLIGATLVGVLIAPGLVR